jgi:hypothetical protein
MDMLPLHESFDLLLLTIKMTIILNIRAHVPMKSTLKTSSVVSSINDGTTHYNTKLSK